MAPEQARGKAVDRRADVWAFGVVLYEMLTGTRAFAGDDITILLASVLKDEVRWDALPADVPAQIRRLLRRCLEKDPKRRLSAIGDARLELDDAGSGVDEAAAASAPAPLKPAAWRRGHAGGDRRARRRLGGHLWVVAQARLRGGAYNFRYLPSGHLVYAEAGALKVVAFDPSSRLVSGAPATVIQGVERTQAGDGYQFALSDNGSLAYLPTSSAGARRPADGCRSRRSCRAAAN
jgi:hypothetical protein